MDPLEIHTRTGGNPFFVTEVLADPGPAAPATVRDAVLARAAALDADARAALDAVAVVPDHAELFLLDGLETPGGGDARTGRRRLRTRRDARRRGRRRPVPAASSPG
jgi:hypothetical protein